ncbi:MAG: hypothetical protein ABIJ00_02025 [Candidatus Eisenbacteria bacterium]
MFRLELLRNEGTSEPFVARMWLGVLELRNQVLSLSEEDPEHRATEFDNLYSPVLDNLETTRTAAKKIRTLISEHVMKVNSGKIVSLQHNCVTIHETITPDTRDSVAALLNAGVRAMKYMQPLLGWSGLSIRHLFQKSGNYDLGTTRLRKAGRRDLAEYLDSVRAGWSESFLELRAAMQHRSWSLGKFHYTPPDQGISLVEPKIEGLDTSEYVRLTAARVIGFVEDLVVYSLGTKLPDGVVIVEVPAERRNPDRPTRFSVAEASGEPLPWVLEYNDQGFC